MDVSDIIEFNLGLLNPNDLTHSYFCLSKDDPTAGFAFDASRMAGNKYPETSDASSCKRCMNTSAACERACSFQNSEESLALGHVLLLLLHGYTIASLTKTFY
jgi:hypothetical protein